MKRRVYTKRSVKRLWSPTKRKVLLLLQAGVALSFAGTLGRQYRIIKELSEEWKQINRKYLYDIMREFKRERLVGMKENADGTKTVTLTEKGKKRLITFNIDRLEIPKLKKWDGKWHVVFFDIPEKRKAAREALRLKLADLGFYHWQKSVFVYPYMCRDQIDFIVEFFDIRQFVRYGALSDITNEAELLFHFNLTKS